MICIGIDVGKFKHCAAVMDDKTGEVLIKSFFFTNDQKGLDLFYSKTKQFLHRKHAVGMEDTGHYMINLTKFLLEKKFTVKYINPRSTALRRKELGMSAKNDRKDALLIAEMLSEKKFWRSVSAVTMQTDKLRELTRLYHQLKEQQNQDMNRLQRALDIVFPEVNTLSWTRYSQSYMQFLSEYPSAASIASEDIRNLRKALEVNGRGRRSKVTAEEIKEAARNSVGDDNTAVALEVQSMIALINTRAEQIDTLDKKIEEFSHQLNSPITSIPGISYITGMTILAEIGDINDFPEAAKLISYAGMEPLVHQSGKYDAAHMPISKHGSRYLRKALYQAVFTVCKYCQVFNDYYTKKRDQGKTYRCAQGHCVRKLLRVIYKLLSTDTVYDSALVH
ncbi:IS110 family transposase [Anaerolactibacter massiliensis]|uniref:IS110 family transposase n=1 Tax=Anaerolactibacter massiliensis TaxID=2044573 RepID=UPI000CF9A5CA|nr:IS110 family transposase [Anaerolactibacter massiliensis]